MKHLILFPIAFVLMAFWIIALIPALIFFLFYLLYLMMLGDIKPSSTVEDTLWDNLFGWPAILLRKIKDSLCDE